jgi:hypothetical protein
MLHGAVTPPRIEISFDRAQLKSLYSRCVAVPVNSTGICRAQHSVRQK